MFAGKYILRGDTHCRMFYTPIFVKNLIIIVLLSVLAVKAQANLSKYEITILTTNIANYGGRGEWSFGALYESASESVLFDTGFDEETMLHNAKLLNKDLSKVEKVVLSHFHSDHTGGLMRLRREYRDGNAKAFSQVYVATGFFAQRYDQGGRPLANGLTGPGLYGNPIEFKEASNALGITFIIVDKPTEIAPDLFVTGPVERKYETYVGPKGLFIKTGNVETLTPDIILDDQSMGMMTAKGWVMMSGCGHAGIMNTSDTLQNIAKKPIFAAMGGFHLWRANDAEVDKTANWLADKGIKKFMGGHCTGIRAGRRIADVAGIKPRDHSHTAVGSTFTKQMEIGRSSVE